MYQITVEVKVAPSLRNQALVLVRIRLLQVERNQPNLKLLSLVRVRVEKARVGSQRDQRVLKRTRTKKLQDSRLM